jgi:hypothetical protein
MQSLSGIVIANPAAGDFGTAIRGTHALTFFEYGSDEWSGSDGSTPIDPFTPFDLFNPYSKLLVPARAAVDVPN